MLGEVATVTQARTAWAALKAKMRPGCRAQVHGPNGVTRCGKSVVYVDGCADHTSGYMPRAAPEAWSAEFAALDALLGSDHGRLAAAEEELALLRAVVDALSLRDVNVVAGDMALDDARAALDAWRVKGGGR